MRSFKFRPVVWLTTIAAILTGLTAASAEPPLDHLLPHAVAGWLGAITVIVTVVVGAVTHNLVTSLARPRDAKRRPLVPKSQGQTSEFFAQDRNDA